MSELGNLVVSLYLDDSEYNAQIAKAKSDTTKFARELTQSFNNASLRLKPIVDDSALSDLNRHLELKRTHFKAVQTYLNANPLRPSVDIKSLLDLSSNLDKAIRLFQSSQNYISSTPIKVKVDDSSLTKLRVDLSSLERDVNIRLNAKFNKTDTVKSAENDTKALLKALDEVQKQVKKSGRKGFLGDVFSGIGQQIGFKIADKGFDISKAQLKKAQKTFNSFTAENPDFQKSVEKSGKLLEERLRKAGYKVGDGIVAALEDIDGDLSSKFNIFIKTAIDKNSIIDSLKTLQKETTESIKDIGGSVFSEKILNDYFSKIGEKLRQQREIALKERAIPLVRNRAAEISNKGSTRNSGNRVTEDTNELFIVTGGYAGARGLSGKALQTDVKKSLTEGQEVIWVKNEDTDIPKSSMSRASSKAMALGTSLAKPHLRGYSKDAVEMASQALAAIEKNPEIKIKFVGESGGGFAAEEAAKILELLGHKNTEYIGVGTPDFIGGMNAQGNKIISPDEILGAETAKLYKRLGLTNSSNKHQSILGVEEHPFVNYQEAGIAEVENFIKGSPIPLKGDEIKAVADAAKQYKNINLEELSSKELKDINKKAFQNLQIIRRQILIATDETKEELEAIAKDFQDVYLKTTPNNRDFAFVKDSVKKASDIFASMQGNEGLEAGAIAEQLVKELSQLQSEFSQKYSKTVGTTKAKYDLLNSELEQSISDLSDPKLGIKQPKSEEYKRQKFQNSDALPTFNRKKDLVPLAEKFGLGDRKELEKLNKNQLIEKLQNNVSVPDLNKEVVKIIVARSDRMIARQEAMLKASEMAGSTTKAIVTATGRTLEVANQIINSQPVQALAKIASDVYAIADGVESAVFEMVPLVGKEPLKKLKAPIRNVGMFMAATHVPGANAVFDALGGGVESAANFGLHLGGGALATTAGNILAPLAPAGQALSHVPGLGHLGHALTTGGQAAGNLALDYAAGGVANVATPLLAGGAINKAVEATAKNAFPNIEADKKLIEGTERKVLAASKEVKDNINKLQDQLKHLEAANKKASKLLPSGNAAGYAYLGSVQKMLPSFEKTLEAVYETIPVNERLSGKEANQLANIKQRLQELTKRVSKNEKIRESVSKQQETIDVVARVVDGDDIEAAKNSIRDSVKNVGASFKVTIDAANTLLENNTDYSRKDAADIAKAVLIKVAEARANIEKLLVDLGDNITPEIKKEIGTTRGKITRSETSAKKILKATDTPEDLGGFIPEGLVKGIDSNLASLKSASHRMNKAVIETTKKDFGIQSPSKLFEQFGDFIVQGFNKGLNAFNPQQASQFFTDFIDNMKETIKGVGSFAVLAYAINLLKDLGITVLGTAIEFERLETVISFASGGKFEGSKNIEELNKQIKDLNVNAMSAYKGYAGLVASTKGGLLEDKTKDINEALLSATASYQLSAEQMDRAFVATQQIISKGTVSSEELKGQLSEAVPGSFQIAARSMGMSTSDFNKELAQGSVKSETFIPKFTRQLAVETASGAEKSAETATGKINNFNNSILQLQKTAGDGLLPIAKLGLDIVNKALEAVKFIAGDVTKVLIFLGVVLTYNASVTLISFIKGLLGAKVSLGSLAGAITKTLTVLRTFGLQMLAFTAITEVFSIIKETFRSGAEEIQDFAKSAETALANYRKALADAGKGSVDFIKKMPKTRDELTGKKGYWEDGILGFLPKDLVRNVETSFVKTSRFIDDRTFRWDWSGNDYKTKAEKENDDTIKETDRVNAAAQGLLGVSSKELNNKDSSLNQLGAIQEKIEKLQGKKAALDPFDTKGIKDYNNEINELLKKQDDLGVPTAELQSSLAIQLQALEDTLKQLDNQAMSDNPTLTQDAYLDKVKETKANIKAIKEQQELVNKAIRGAVTQTILLNQQFNLIEAKLQSGLNKADTKLAQQQANISDSQASGNSSQVQADLSRTIAQQNTLNEKVNLYNNAIRESQNLLSDSQLQQTLTNFGLQGADSATIRARIENRSLQDENFDKSKEGRMLDAAAKATEKIEQSRLQVAELQKGVSDERLQATEKLRDLSRSLADYYKSVSDSVEDMESAIKDSNLETVIIETKNKLSARIRGFSNKFFGDLGEQLSSLIDTLYEPLRNSLDAQKQVQGLQRQLRDQIQQGQDLANQFTPGGTNPSNNAGVTGATTPFTGIQVTSAVDASGEPGLDYVVEDGRRGANFGSLTNGEVIETVTDQNWESNLENGDTRRGYGNRVIIRTVDEVTGEFVDLLYAHLDSVAVQVGQRVGVGSVLGTQGRTGSTTGAHVSVDFFGKDSNSASSASIAMRDRIARTLANNPSNLNSQIRQSQQTNNQPITSNQNQGLTAEQIQLITLSILEASSKQGRVDAAVNVHNRLNSPRVGGANYGNSLTEVMFAEGQYEPFFTITPQQLQTTEDAINLLQRLRGFSREGALQAINETTGLLQDPNAIADANRHVGGRTYFKGVYEYDNRVPSEDPLRNDGENFFHIEPKTQTYELLNRIAQLTPNNLLGSNTATPASNSAVNTPGVDPRIINNANSQIRASVDSSIEASQRRLEALNESAAQKLRQQIDQFRRTIENGSEELTDTAIEQQRQLEDAQIQAETLTPELEYQVSIRDINREEEDKTKNLRRELREANEGLALLEEYRRNLLEIGKTNPEVLELIPDLDKTIGTTRTQIAELQNVFDQLAETFESRRRKITEDYVREQDNRAFEFESRRLGLRGNLEDANLQNLRTQGRGEEAITRDFDSRVLEANQALASEMNALDNDLYNKKIDASQYELLKNILEELNRVSLANIRNELERTRESFNFENRETIARSNIEVMQATLENTSGDGFDDEALQKEIAIAQQEIDFASQIEQLNEMAESGNYAASTIEALRQNYEKLNEIKLDGINEQFDYGRKVTGFLKDSTTSLFGDLIRGSKSAGDAFRDFLGGLADQFAQLASKMIVNQLFGFLIKSAGSGTEGGFLGDVLGGGNILTASSGGLVPAIDTGNLRDSNNIIGRALRLEGSNSVLAALTPNERILSVAQNREFERMGLDRVFNFKDGGVVGNVRTPSFANNIKGGDINIPISISGDSNTSIDTVALRNEIESVVVRRLNNENRPRGIGYTG